MADKVKMLDRTNAGEARQKPIAEMGTGMRTLERIVAKESEIRETAATAQDASRKLKQTGKHDNVDSALALGSWFRAV